ncbi:MAG: hypothetical protein LBU28_07000, partial [Spirochaetaceae bacterium]|nr:hypothetical protein [Spirochaetaceae bacterium]
MAMNMDRDLVNRALLDVGQQPLIDADIPDNTVYRLCKGYYLQTFLEALSEIEWTGGRKRDRLMKTHRPHLPTGYRFVYDMPFDCARPIALQDNGYFAVEDRYICTDVARAELLYVTNGKILRPVAAVACGGPGDLMDMEYLSCGWPDTEPDVTLVCGGPGDLPPADAPSPVLLPPDPEPVEDYPDYRPPEYEPKFYQYVEKALAAKFAMKISTQPELHLALLQEAMVLRQEAMAVSKAAGAAKRQPKRWWGEELGLSTGNRRG